MEERNCKSIRDNLLWDYAAQRLKPEESDAVDAHLNVCRECETSFVDVSSMSRGFKHLPAAAVPSLVGTSLQVLASRERSRRLLRLNPAAWMRDKLARVSMSFDNFLRPFAVPATGGILASCLCFSLIAHTLQLRPYMIGEDDMPVALYTQVMIDDLFHDAARHQPHSG
jgi:anti-sigma factor RsiW